MDSLEHIERLFSEQFKDGAPVPNGFFSDQLGAKVFAIGSYLGEVIVQSSPEAKWQTDDSDPRGEINVKVIAPNGAEVLPVHRVIKRMKEGGSASVKEFAASVVGDAAG